MNCATHNEVVAVAYCRTCGKPLCANCTRDVRGAIYCENCLAVRLEGALPPATAIVPPAGGAPGGTPLAGTGGPNPAVAGILGAIPFGVGAIYCGQYAKGLAHMIIFTLLVLGASRAQGGLGVVFGFGIAFFVFYQIFDAVRTAKALQAGQPAPDPFGLGQSLGAGEKVDTAKVPTAAVVLIGLGFLFLLQTLGLFEFNFDRFWPVLLIGVGGWLFARRFGLMGLSGREQCQTRGLVGPAVLVTVGVLSLIESFDGPGWHRTWPVLLLVIGLVKLLESKGSSPMRGGTGSPGVGTGEVQPPSSEVKNG